MHVLLLNPKDRKIRQLRRSPPLFRQNLLINLTEMRMKNYFKPNENKKKEKLRNTENSKIMKLAEKKIDVSIFRIYRKLKNV